MTAPEWERPIRVMVLGANSTIGKPLVKRLLAQNFEVIGTTRETLDFLNVGDLKRFPVPNVIYIVAARTRFIECEDDPSAYRVNVDAPVTLASYWNFAKVVFLSSEAVERALHTNYGMHKALAEAQLRSVCSPVIARICGKVSPERLDSVCEWLVALMDKQPGVHRWAA